MRVRTVICLVTMISLVLSFGSTSHSREAHGKLLDASVKTGIVERLPPDSPDVLSFIATPSAIRKGERSILRWRVSGEADNILIIRDRQLPAIKRVEAEGQLTVTLEETASYQLLVRFADDAVERSVTVLVVKNDSPILWKAQACLYIENKRGGGPLRCVEPERCFTTDPGTGSKRLYDTVTLLLRFRDLPPGSHRIKTTVWGGDSYPASEHAARYDQEFTFRNRDENYARWFSIGSDGRTRYWRIGIFLDNNWVGQVEFRLCVRD